MICSVTQQAVSRTDLWRVHHGLKDNEILHQLTEALAAVKVWVSTCKTLTDTYWPNYSLHEWKGKPYVPVFCQNFQKRLEEVSLQSIPCIALANSCIELCDGSSQYCSVRVNVTIQHLVISINICNSLTITSYM